MQHLDRSAHRWQARQFEAIPADVECLLCQGAHAYLAEPVGGWIDWRKRVVGRRRLAAKGSILWVHDLDRLAAKAGFPEPTQAYAGQEFLLLPPGKVKETQLRVARGVADGNDEGAALAVVCFSLNDLAVTQRGDAGSQIF